LVKAVGIDLGTTFSAVAYIDEEGKPKILRNRDGDNLTPSVVNFDENGEPLVGRLAKEMSVDNTDSTIMFVKRYMGAPSWKFPVGEEEYTSEIISSIILKRLKEDAESMLGEEIKDVVITVPAYFGDAQRLATSQAGKIAGFNVLKVISEPTAAALAYGVGVGKNETILVFDLGGGTFDVTIMNIDGKDIKVLATRGDKNLGGFDWDNKVMEYLRDVVLSEKKIDLYEQEHGMNRLRKIAESAKIALSDKQTAPITLDIGGNQRVKIDLAREKFNELTESLNNNTIDMALFALDDAELGWDDIDKILLVGGSTRMPIIRELIEKSAGRKPSSELHPDEVVAMGAAIQAAIILAEERRTDLAANIVKGLPPAPKDICSHSLGITAVKGAEDSEARYNAIVMPRNTEIPGKTSEIFCTLIENQKTLHIEVNEGEGEDLDYVTKIGEGSLDLPPHRKGSPLEVFFEYDQNQIIHVNVYDKTNNNHLGEIRIERKANMDDAQVAKFTALMRKTGVS